MKKIILIVIALVLSISLTACSSSNSSESGSDDGKIQIKLMHSYFDADIGSNPEATGVLTMLKKYQEDHPEIEIIEEQLQWDDYNVKAQALAAADDLPDVFIVPGSWMTNFVNNGVVSPLNEDLESRSEWSEGYREGTMDAGTRDGKRYGIPIAAGPTSLVYYNSELYKSVGYDEFPKTWDEFVDANEKLKDKGVTPISYGNDGAYTLSSWLSSLTDRITGPEWTESIIAGDGAAFTDNGFVQATTLINDMAKSDFFNKDLNSINPDTMIQYYFEGKSAAFVWGIWSAQNIVNNAPKEILDATKVAVLPAVEGGKGNPLSSSGGAGVYYSLNSKLESGEKRDAILDMLEYMTGKESAQIMAEVGGFPAFNPGEFDKNKLHRVAQEAYDASNAANATKIYDLWFDASVVEAINTNIQEMLAGSKTPEQVGKEVQSVYEKFLKNKE